MKIFMLIIATRQRFGLAALSGLVIFVCLLASLGACKTRDSDDLQNQQQERILAEGTAQTGMPGIHNFRERKMLKQIFELRDQEGLVTYTYFWSSMTGQLVPFCDSIGYGFPAATQYTSPMKWDHYNGNPYTLPQADPNGLFSPNSAEGTWIMCKDPQGAEARPVYVEERIVVSPFRMVRQIGSSVESPGPTSTGRRVLP